VRAFGREFVLDETQLRQLKGMSVNGMHLSYEPGYPEVGGRTLYLELSTTYSGELHNKRRLAVSERGGINVGPLETE
jgi:hypothetical protein